jgi:CTP:molybdopterin cytidylyltransferase MocA
VERLAEADALVVTLGDQPAIAPPAIVAVLEELDGPEAAVRATYDGTPGHPVVLKRALFDRLRELRGDAGARAVLEGVAVRERECGALGRPDDVDTPEQLGALRHLASSQLGPTPRSTASGGSSA